MAIANEHQDHAVPDIKIGPKTATVIFYVLIAILAMAIAIPAAIMSSDILLFEECYASADICNG